MIQSNVSFKTEELRKFAEDEPKAFASAIGVSLSALYLYLRGRTPRADVLYRIAKHTGQPMESFFEEEALPQRQVVSA